MHSRFSRLVLAASVLGWTACSGKKSTTQPPVTTASISVSAASPTLSVQQGATGTATITVGRTSFSGDVALTAEALPTGVTATFTPATLSAGATSSSLSLAVSGTAATGPAVPITVRARGTGVSDATTSIALTVTPVVGGGVTVALSPTADSIVAGQSTSTVVALTRTGGFASGVNMTVTGAPTGVTTTFANANPVTANSVNLSIATLTSVVPGSYTLTVRANATGLTEATAAYVLQVAAPPSNNVTWRYCDTGRFPVWFAYQDGATGTWERVTETSPGVYDFAYGQPQVGIATVTNVLGKTETSVRYFGLAEVPAAAAAECTQNAAAGTKTYTGTVSGFSAATQVATVSIGTALSNATNQSTPNFTINNVVDGPLDVIAVRADLVSSSVLRAFIARGVNLANNASLGTLDLAGGTSFAPATGNLTVTGPNDGAIQAQNRFFTATRSGAAFNLGAVSSGASTTYQGVPEANMLATDLQRVEARQEVSANLTRFVTRYTRGPTNVNLTMPVDPASPTITSVAGGGYPRARVTGPLQAVVNGDVSFVFDQSARAWRLTATKAGRGGSETSYELTMPDFSGVAGWQATWALASGSADVTSTFNGQNAIGSPAAPTTGTEFFNIGRLTTFTLP